MNSSSNLSATAAPAVPERLIDESPPPADLAARCRQLIPHDGELNVDELEQLVLDIREDSTLWEPLILVDPSLRRYRLLYEDDRLDVWVLSWMPGQGTGFHDHDLSGVGLVSAQGSVIEKQMLLPEGATEIEMTPGVSRQGPAGYIHSVAHHSGEPAITIHAYSPKLIRVGQFRADANGVLSREVEFGRKELIDSTIAAIDPSRA
ncbi:MAG: cysteine dioxygenase family protein [Gaiellales bacterium]